MIDRKDRRILVTESELIAASALVEARFDDPAEEAMRIEIARRFLTAALSLERALRMHARCALVNHCGSHGTSNLVDAARGLFEALEGYVERLGESAQRKLADEHGSGPPHVTAIKLEVA